jgi:3-dehydroquinate dehydratase type II
MRILLLNGPNLNLLGTRDPDVYGDWTLVQLQDAFRGWARGLGVTSVECDQSNHEGVLIDRIHAARGAVDGIVFNPGAYTHTSYALHDAIAAVGVPTVETHISDVETREDWRRRSVVGPACVHRVYGRGIDGYRWALRHLVAMDRHPPTRLAYGTAPEQFADLRLPVGDGPFPVAVIVHGGFWRHQWTRETIELLALDLPRRGVATLNVEYRRVGRAGGDGGATASVDDVVEAVLACLDQQAIDPGHVALLGHSAGAQLAFVAARSLGGQVDRSPRMVVSLAGVLDLVGARAEGVGEGAVAAYLGQRNVEALSPLELVPLGMPTLLAHGTADDEVPMSQTERYAAAAAMAGDQVEVLTGDHDHYAYLQPDDPAWTAVADRVVAALRP